MTACTGILSSYFFYVRARTNANILSVVNVECTRHARNANGGT